MKPAGPSPRRSLRHALRAAVAASPILLCLSEPARADCAPDNPAPGGTVTCTGFDADGFAVSNTPVTVLIGGGATVAGPGMTIQGTGDALIENFGAIQSSSPLRCGSTGWRASPRRWRTMPAAT